MLVTIGKRWYGVPLGFLCGGVYAGAEAAAPVAQAAERALHATCHVHVACPVGVGSRPNALGRARLREMSGVNEYWCCSWSADALRVWMSVMTDGPCGVADFRSAVQCGRAKRHGALHRDGKGKPSPGADVAGVGPIPAYTCGRGKPQSRRRCGQLRPARPALPPALNGFMPGDIGSMRSVFRNFMWCVLNAGLEAARIQALVKASAPRTQQWPGPSVLAIGAKGADQTWGRLAYRRCASPMSRCTDCSDGVCKRSAARRGGATAERNLEPAEPFQHISGRKMRVCASAGVCP